jgi:predicted RNA-binding Zn-ribbon protein involved in translation (DUF1610 family)
MENVDPLDLIFERLVRAVRNTRPEFLTRPFEVAELIELVPYQSARAEGVVQTNDDYAHALTRLLAGERGYVFADDLLQDDLRTELSSPNPDLAAYRSYLTARVTISQQHARKAGEAMPEPPTTPAAPMPAAAVMPAAAAPTAPPAAGAIPDTRGPLAEAVTVAKPMRPPPVTAPVARPLDPAAETAPQSSRPGCRYCGQALPEDRPAHFCPSCGQNLLARRCAACSAELEPGWKFCVACGRLAAS